MVLQSRQQALRAYCSNIYTVATTYYYKHSLWNSIGKSFPCWRSNQQLATSTGKISLMEFLVAVYFGQKLTNKDVVRIFYIMTDGAPPIEVFKIKIMSKKWKFPGDENSFNNFIF